MKTRVTIKSVGPLKHYTKKDGSGTGVSRDIVIEFTDKETLDHESLLVSLFNERAENFQWQEGDMALAKISFSIRTSEKTGEKYQNIYLSNLAPLNQEQGE